MLQMLKHFLRPFYHLLKQRNLKVEIFEVNKIPEWACTDWTIFEQVLFHLVQNAIKFNQDGGLIKISVSYHSFREEFTVAPRSTANFGS